MYLFVHREEMDVSLFLAGIAHPCSESEKLIGCLLGLNYVVQAVGVGKLHGSAFYRMYGEPCVTCYGVW